MSRLWLALPILSLALTVLIGGHYYIAQRLVLEAELAPELGRVLLAVIAALGGSLILQPIGERLMRPPYARLIAWPASLWMGLFFYLLLLLPLSDLVLWLGGGFALADSGAGRELVAIGRARAVGVLTLALVAASAGIRSGLRDPVLLRVGIALKRWPRSRGPLRIVQISDLHLGSILGRRFASRLVERVNALAPDLVAVTGDLVDGSVRRLAGEVAPLADLRAPLGVYFVTGNHDHYSGARSWVEHVRGLGMRVLRNEHVTIGEGKEAFELAGVDDHRAHLMPGESGEDLEQALAGVVPERPVVLLAHDPSTFKRASSMGVDLQLSGHTHGGQIWPFGVFIRLVIPFVAGLYRRGRAQLYVSRGTGFWGPPMRLFAPAEITEIVVGSPGAVPEASGNPRRRIG